MKSIKQSDAAIVLASMILTSLAASRARACDFCAEDRAHAAYSFKNFELARKSGNFYSKVSFDGLTSGEDASEARRILDSIPGVKKETIRISAEAHSGSFVRDRAVRFETIAREFAKRSQSMRIELLGEDR